MIGVPIGLLVANTTEWMFHKFVLHELGKAKNSFWRFHWKPHHNSSRRNNFIDADYEKSAFESIVEWNAQGKELAALFVAAVIHMPLLPLTPFYTLTIWYCVLNYYRKHKKSHLFPKWAKKELYWHWLHHMGKDQNKNWGVTHPFFDFVMGTSTMNPPDRVSKLALNINKLYNKVRKIL